MQSARNAIYSRLRLTRVRVIESVQYVNESVHSQLTACFNPEDVPEAHRTWLTAERRPGDDTNVIFDE